MKIRLTIWFRCGALFASIVVNFFLARANLSYFDRAYGNLAQQYLTNARVRELLEESEVEVAKDLLDQELEFKGAMLAICLMENCSDSAKEIMHGEVKRNPP